MRRCPATAGRDDNLHQILSDRGWRSDGVGLPEEGDRFEWPPSIPTSAVAPTSGISDVPYTFGTTIYVEIVGYSVDGPQVDDQPVRPRAVYSSRAELLHDIRCVEFLETVTIFDIVGHPLR